MWPDDRGARPAHVRCAVDGELDVSLESISTIRVGLLT
jgi:hypothetical protein